MNPSTVQLLIVLLLSSCTCTCSTTIPKLSPSLESLAAQLEQMGKDLVREAAGYVEFWFVNLPGGEAYGTVRLFERLIVAEPFVSHPKVIILDESGFDLMKARSFRATLAIAIVGDDLQKLSSNLLLNFDIETKFVVIFPFSTEQQLFTVMQSFQSNHLLNIVYAAVLPDNDRFALFNYLAWKEDPLTFLSEYRFLDQAFPEQADLGGSEIVGCTHPNGIFVGLDSKTGLPDGLHVKLVNLVVSRMNGRLGIAFTECLRTDSDMDCIQRRLSRPDCAFHFDRWRISDSANGVPIMPMHTLVILVPRGGMFSTWDLLRAPFKKRLWNALYASFIICIVGMRIFFKRSGFKVLLHIVCGIGGSYLKRRSTLEKWISISLQLLMFLLLSAYEAKIVSLLSNWPYLADINSVDELCQARVPVAIGIHFTPESVLKDPRLKDLFILIHPTTNNSLIIPSNAAIVKDYESAQIITRQRGNFNYETNRARFVMIDERLDTQLSFFYFGHRNVLKNRFGQIYQLVQEAGFINHWKNMISFDSSLYKAETQKAPQFIEFQQLKLLKSLFYFLWLGSVIIFLLELLWFRITQARKHRRISAVRQRAQTYPLMRRSNKTPRKSI